MNINEIVKEFEQVKCSGSRCEHETSKDHYVISHDFLTSKLTEYGKSEREAGREFGQEEGRLEKDIDPTAHNKGWGLGYVKGRAEMKKEAIEVVGKHLHRGSDVFKDLHTL